MRLTGSGCVGASASAAATPAASSSATGATALDGGTPSSTTDQSSGLPKSTLDLSALPLGNQKFSTSAPAAGSVYLCHAMQGGYSMYVEYDSSGNLLTDASLDACHGRTSVVPWHGELVSMYHYDMTIEFPYSVACYHGTPISAAASGGLIGH